MRLLYSTHPTLEQARATADVLLASGLAACCNIVPSIESHYVWRGTRERIEEVILFSKVSNASSNAAMEAIRAQHPYECPAILELAIERGNPAFLAWVEQSAKPR